MNGLSEDERAVWRMRFALGIPIESSHALVPNKWVLVNDHERKYAASHPCFDGRFTYRVQTPRRRDEGPA